MIRVAHIVPLYGVGGAEQMALDLCRWRDAAAFDCVVASPINGPIAAEIRRSGTPVYIGPDACRAVARQADLVNLHWMGPSLFWPNLIRGLRQPFVVTLHTLEVLPRLPAVTICTSEYAYRAQEHRDRCVVIPNGVDLTRFSPPRPRQGKEVILTRVCRPPKCAIYFWEAMERVLERYPQTRLWIVGNPRPCRGEHERIRFWGIRRDVPAILAETDLFVYTPYPGLGSMDLVPIEAAAAGVPCVVSDVGAVRPAVVPGKNGYRVRFGDVEAFVEKVGRLVEDGELRARMSEEAVRIAREQFDIRAVCCRYEVVYRAVLEAYRSHSGRG